MWSRNLKMRAKSSDAETETRPGLEAGWPGLITRSGRRVRRDVDPFGIGDHAPDGSRVSQGAYVVARHISRVFGDLTAVVGRYWEALARASEQDLLRLRRNGVEIVFAPTIASALRTPWATARRGRALTAQELTRVADEFGENSRAAAAYFSDVRALVLPTAYCAEDLEHVVLHELGHALTMSGAAPVACNSGHLLEGLPNEVREHLAHYPQGRSPAAVAERVLEALAEAYVFLVVGRAAELPAPLVSALLSIMGEMDSPHTTSRRSGANREQGRSVTYVEEEHTIDHRHSTRGHEFAAVPQVDEELVESFVGDSVRHRPSQARAASS